MRDILDIKCVRVDDLDGSEAEGTVVSGVDGMQYEIDLSEKNAAKLRDLFAPVGAGRKVRGATRTPRTTAAPRTSREDSKGIREWAAAQGMAISACGRTSSQVRDVCSADGPKLPALHRRPLSVAYALGASLVSARRIARPFFGRP